ncbi:MAG: C25 family cysteine peptidase, partial [Pseudomonadota bacterium]|nr:C25 family cysteine peptidase [Pseudomonadota bacterium]
MADRRFAQTSEDVALFLSDPAYLGQYQVDRIYYTPNAVTPENWGYWFSGGPAGNMGQSIPNHLKKPNFTWRGNLYDISDAINEGRFLVTHRDHGTRWGWDAPYYHDTQASELTNGNKLPVVWSVNCETGWFDNETDHPSWTSSDAVHFSEVWERNPNGGAIGVIAATRVSYSGYNDRLFWGWADAIWPDFEPNYNGSTSKTLANHMGTVLNYGKYYLAEKYGEGTTRKLEFEIFHWFGDPTLPMWTQVPQTLSVSYDEGLTAGSTAVAVSVDTADALISVAKDNAGNGEILGRALSTQNQATTITWSTPLAAGDQVYLTITKHNYRPYQYDKLIESEYLAPITYLLTVNQQGSGSGEMTSTDGVIVCGDNCQTEYAADATVELTAKADADSIFSGWSLDCSGSEPQTTLTMDADKSCQANFEKKTVQLTIVQPSGGEVTSDDGLLSCGSNCEASYTVGESVSLTATPAANMVFSSWSG